MSAPPLSDTQRALLEALVDRHAEVRQPVARATLAEMVECHPVTVSTRMQNLLAHDLATSTSGPKGGYEPTVTAHDALVDRVSDDMADVPITIGGEAIEDIHLHAITFPGVHDPEWCHGELLIEGSLTEFGLREAISIGPLPTTKLRIEGIVVEKDRADGVVSVEVEAMHAPADDAS